MSDVVRLPIRSERNREALAKLDAEVGEVEADARIEADLVAHLDRLERKSHAYRRHGDYRSR